MTAEATAIDLATVRAELDSWVELQGVGHEEVVFAIEVWEGFPDDHPKRSEVILYLEPREYDRDRHKRFSWTLSISSPPRSEGEMRAVVSGCLAALRQLFTSQHRGELTMALMVRKTLGLV